MKITYLVNQYPKVSHSFIRREIAALEKLGMAVHRVSIRQIPLADLSDERDMAEHAKTVALLGPQGLLRVFLSFLQWFGKSPGKTMATFFFALKFSRKTRKSVLRHLVYLAEAARLVAILEEEEVEHLHAHFGTNSATVAMFCRLLGGPRYSFTVHGPEEFDDPKGLGLKEKMFFASFVVAISSFGRSQLMRWCSYGEWDKIKLVRCTVDDSFVSTAAKDLFLPPRLVCVGRICEQKGQLLLLQAMQKLRDEGVTFSMVFAGDGEMRRELEAAIDTYGLRGQITVTGWLSGDAVRDEILASRAMVLPSFAEGLPVVIMEAFALMRPVLSTAIAGIPELVEDGANGWLVPAGSVDALAEALKDILEKSPEQLLDFGKNGRQRVLTQHNDAIEAKKLMHYIKEVD